MYTDDYNLGLCEDELLYTNTPMRTILERADLKDPFAVDNVLSSLSTSKYASRTFKKYKYDGEVLTIEELSERSYIPVSYVQKCVGNMIFGNPVDDVLKKEVQRYTGHEYFVWKGIRRTIQQIAYRLYVSPRHVLKCVNRVEPGEDVTDLIPIDYEKLIQDPRVLNKKFPYMGEWVTFADISRRSSTDLRTLLDILFKTGRNKCFEYHIRRCPDYSK